MDDKSLQSNERDVRKRDIDGATLEDKFDKQLMPKVMQVKNFGRSGQTKYTHLADQDTSTRADLWQQDDEYVVSRFTFIKLDSIRKKFHTKLGGVGDIDNAGRKHKRVRR